MTPHSEAPPHVVDFTPLATATVLPQDFGWAQFEYWNRVQEQQARPSKSSAFPIEEVPSGPAADPHVQAWSNTVQLYPEMS